MWSHRDSFGNISVGFEFGLCFPGDPEISALQIHVMLRHESRLIAQRQALVPFAVEPEPHTPKHHAQPKMAFSSDLCTGIHARGSIKGVCYGRLSRMCPCLRLPDLRNRTNGRIPENSVAGCMPRMRWAEISILISTLYFRRLKGMSHRL